MRAPNRAALIVAWVGAAAFVASLLYFFFFYVVLLDAPTAPAPRAGRAAAIDVAWFTLFALHHSLLARSGLKQRIATLVAPGLERSLYVWVASVLFFLSCWNWRRIGGDAYAADGIAAVALAALQVAGVILMARSTLAIDPLELAGVRQAYDADRGPAAPESVALSTHGVYGLVRHPLYLGWALFVFGAAHMTRDRLLFAAISTAYLIVAIPWEERSLVRQHGAAYEAYRRQIRWRMVPGLY